MGKALSSIPRRGPVRDVSWAMRSHTKRPLEGLRRKAGPQGSTMSLPRRGGPLRRDVLVHQDRFQIVGQQNALRALTDHVVHDPALEALIDEVGVAWISLRL